MARWCLRKEFRSEVGKSDGAAQRDVTQEKMNCIFRDLIAFYRISLPFVISDAKVQRLML